MGDRISWRLPLSNDSSPAGVDHQVRVLGRRKSERKRCTYEVGCEGADGAFRGRLVNLSRTGALLHLANQQFQASTDADLVEVFTRIQSAFAEGMTIYFLHCKAAVQATL